MCLVFKLSFLLHRVTNQNFKKNEKFLIINKAKIKSKKNIEKRVWMTSQLPSQLHVVHVVRFCLRSC